MTLTHAAATHPTDDEDDFDLEAALAQSALLQPDKEEEPVRTPAAEVTQETEAA